MKLRALCPYGAAFACAVLAWSGEAPPGTGHATSFYAGTLAFQSDRNGNWDVYLLQADGSGLARLTRHRADDVQPDFSPDGAWIAFTSKRSGKSDIYIMNVDGSGLRRLTDHPAFEAAPSWSPDGRWIAFEGERDGRSEIYRVEVSTGNVERLTRSMSRKLGPAYSPGGGLLAYMERSILRWQIAVLDLRRSSAHILTTGWGNCRPAWSPDGRLLAFVSTRESEKADIRLWDIVRGTDWKLRSRPNAYNYDPRFSPDGKAVAFASTLERRPEQWDLFLVDINGRSLVQLTSGPANDRFPVWRPVRESK